MITTSNIPLKVPFKEKDEAKSLGARWNPDGKHWYVPEGIDAEPFEKWLDGAPPPVAVSANMLTEKPAINRQSALPADTELDDINAMLRDAYEVNDE
jgi:hypothetical protein